MTREFWAVLEHTGATLHEQSEELLCELSDIAHRQQGQLQVCAVLLHDEQQKLPDMVPLQKRGIAHLLLLLHPVLASYSTSGYVAALAWLIQQRAPALIATHATPNGCDWAPRLAAQLRLPFAPNCLGIDLHEDALLALRSLYESRAYAQTRTALRGRTALVTFVPGIRGTAMIDAATSVSELEVTRFYPELQQHSNPVRQKAIQAPSPEEVALDAAERIVAGGRGIGQTGFTTIAKFARHLGAAVGATRVATDLGWIEHTRQIGATGKIVRPRLYIACGISGAAQHTSGMSESQTIIAINPDRSAPIFALADLGLLGDANEILPLADKLLDSAVETASGVNQKPDKQT
jgi:electron transfer flavoprotein alpha subunit